MSLTIQVLSSTVSCIFRTFKDQNDFLGLSRVLESEKIPELGIVYGLL